jgi:hypothetical protein
MTKQELKKAVSARLTEMRGALSNLDDEAALSVAVCFEEWKPGRECVAEERLRHNGKLYRVVQTHIAQEGWGPDITPALFTEVAEPGVIPVWKQPTGAQDAYNKDDMVHYPDEDGPVYISTIDANVWAPGVYGWDEVA